MLHRPGRLLLFLMDRLWQILRFVLLAVFVTVLLLGLVIKPMYHFADYPYFTAVGWRDLLGLVLVGSVYGLGWWLYRRSRRLRLILRPSLAAGLFLGAASLFIWQVPTLPFSDMRGVYAGALAAANGQWSQILQSDYLQTFKVNINVSLFYGLWLRFLPQAPATLKIINSLLVLGLAWLISDGAARCVRPPEPGPARCVKGPDTLDPAAGHQAAAGPGQGKPGQSSYTGLRNGLFLLTLTFIAPFLYIQHLYYDLPFTFIWVLAFYVYWRNDRSVPALLGAAALLALGKFLRPTGDLYLLALLFDFTVHQLRQQPAATGGSDNTTSHGRRSVGTARPLKGRQLLAVLLLAALCFGLPATLLQTTVDVNLHDPARPSYPRASLLYIGLNEPEFGFMDFSMSFERTWQDVWDRVAEYGPWRLGKIFARKILWTWMEGTYQAQRYAFGENAEFMPAKFAAPTWLTPYLQNDYQQGRQFLNSVIRAQYLLFFTMMVLYLAGRRRCQQLDLLLIPVFATFFLLIFFEIKSRYIFTLYPAMLLWAQAWLADARMPGRQTRSFFLRR